MGNAHAGPHIADESGVPAMTAQPLHHDDPDDPVEILRVLPAKYHEQFRTEYEAAAEGARHPEGYRKLHELLRLWRLTAMAVSAADYDSRLQAQREAVRTGSHEGCVPIEEIVPDWAERVTAHRAQRQTG
jgi:hypothetical protein